MAKKRKLPEAFGPDDVTIVISGNRGMTKLYVGDRQIGCLQNVDLQVDSTNQIPRLKVSFPGLVGSRASEELRSSVSTHMGLVKQFPWADVVTKPIE